MSEILLALQLLLGGNTNNYYEITSDGPLLVSVSGTVKIDGTTWTYRINGLDWLPHAALAPQPPDK